MRFALFLAALAAAALAPGKASAWPWVDAVVSYSPGPGLSQGEFRNPARLLGPPIGVSVQSPSPDSVVTLGDGGNVVLQFNDLIFDDPRNPKGLDFIIFSNAFWRGGDPAIRWQEPAFVEVSQDEVTWYLILPNILPAALKSPPDPIPDIGMSSTILRGYAEYTPTLALPPGVRNEEFYTVPDGLSFEGDPDSLLIDEGSGGGDAMDLAWAVVESAPGVPALDAEGQPVPAHPGWVKYIRLTDAKTGDYAGVSGELSADIDSVAVVAPEAQTIGQARKEDNGRIARISEGVVTRILSGGVFLEAKDRSSGIYAAGISDAQPGDVLRVTGKLHQTPDGLEVETFFYDKTETAPLPGPVMVSLRDLTRTPGLSADGLLVTTWGRVTEIASGGYVITGASGAGATVLSEGAPVPEGSLVRVRAAVRISNSGPVLYATDPADVTVLAPPQ